MLMPTLWMDWMKLKERGWLTRTQERDACHSQTEKGKENLSLSHCVIPKNELNLSLLLLLLLHSSLKFLISSRMYFLKPNNKQFFETTQEKDPLSLSLLSLSNNFFFYRNDTSKKSGKTDNENIFIPSACQPEMKKNLKFKEERRKEGGGEVLKPEKNTFLLASSWGSSSSNCVFLVLVQFNYILCCCLASSPSQPAPAISRVPILCKINDLSPYMMSKKEQKGKIIKIFFSLQKHNCIPLALLVLFLS